MDFRLSGLPTKPLILTWYIQFLNRKLKAVGSILGYLSGVKKLHNMLGLQTTSFSSLIVTLTLQGIRRTSTHMTRQALPMTPEILLKIQAVMDFRKEEDMLFWGICITAFFLLFRKSNLIPVGKWDFDPNKQITREDLRVELDRIIVGIRWSKTHQFSRELLTFPLPRIQGSPLCPYTAVVSILNSIKAEGKAHLFQRSDGSSYMYRTFQERLHVVLADLGVENSKDFGSHSFRRGGCTFAFLSGVPCEVIRILGSWKSDCYLQYLYFPLEAHTAASELMRIRLMHYDHYKPVC